MITTSCEIICEEITSAIFGSILNPFIILFYSCLFMFITPLADCLSVSENLLNSLHNAAIIPGRGSSCFICITNIHKGSIASFENLRPLEIRN